MHPAIDGSMDIRIWVMSRTPEYSPRYWLGGRLVTDSSNALPLPGCFACCSVAQVIDLFVFEAPNEFVE